MVKGTGIRRRTTVAGCVVALGLGTFAAGPAQAAASQRVRPYPTAVEYAVMLASAVTLRPGSCAADAWVVLRGTHWNVYVCGATTAPTAGLGPFNSISSSVANCVVLHQNADGSGWSDARVGPAVWQLSGQDQNPASIEVSADSTC